MYGDAFNTARVQLRDRTLYFTVFAEAFACLVLCSVLMMQKSFGLQKVHPVL